MTITFEKHKIDNDDPWWFDLGISYQQTKYLKSKHVFVVGLCFWSIYIRWGSNDR